MKIVELEWKPFYDLYKATYYAENLDGNKVIVRAMRETNWPVSDPDPFPTIKRKYGGCPYLSLYDGDLAMLVIVPKGYREHVLDHIAENRGKVGG